MRALEEEGEKRSGQDVSRCRWGVLRHDLSRARIFTDGSHCIPLRTVSLSGGIGTRVWGRREEGEMSKSPGLGRRS